MVDASVAKRLVQAIIDNLPSSQSPGRRPVHTIGIGVKGEFVASDVARTYCIAEHFKGQPVPVSMRFSNGWAAWSSMMDGPMSGEWRYASTCRTETASDLIATTLGEFFVRNVDGLFRIHQGREARASIEDDTGG